MLAPTTGRANIVACCLLAGGESDDAVPPAERHVCRAGALCRPRPDSRLRPRSRQVVVGRRQVLLVRRILHRLLLPVPAVQPPATVPRRPVLRPPRSPQRRRRRRSPGRIRNGLRVLVSAARVATGATPAAQREGQVRTNVTWPLPRPRLVVETQKKI